MREYWILTKLQGSSLFGINRIRHEKDGAERKKRRREVLLLLVMAFSLIYISVLYSSLMISALAPMGLADLVLLMMAAASSVIVFLFSLFETKGVLFGFGDYDTVMSWPVRASAVAASRLTAMYVYNLVYALLFLLPAGAVYAVYVKPPFLFYPRYLALSLFLPLLPTALGALLGTATTLLTARLKKSGLMSAVLQMALLGGIMFASMRFNSGITEIGDKVASLSAPLMRLYPPALWFTNAVAGADVGGALLLVLTGVGAIALFALLLSRGFVRINTRLSATQHGKKRFVVGRQAQQGVVAALYRKEWRRYLSSSIYVSNTAFGYVLLLALAVVLGVVRPAAIEEMMAAPELAALSRSVPFLMGLVVTMAATTGSAVSMEGKHLWIVKSMPVRARDWLLSKLLVSLTLAVPSVLIAATVIAVGRGVSFAEWAAMAVIPLCYAVFSGMTGLWLNLLLPKFDWRTEAEVVKQGAAVGIQIFLGMAMAGLPVAALFFTGSPLVFPAAAALLLIVSAALFYALIRSGDRRLSAL